MSRKPQRISQFVQAAPREGCVWTVFVNLNENRPTAVPCKIVALPTAVTEIRAARRSCEAVARRIAAKLNASRSRPND